MKNKLCWIVAGLMLGAMGCDQATTVGQCGGDSVLVDDVVDTDGGVGNGKPTDGVEPLADGASCDEGAQCESGYCVPSANDFGTGVCFSLATIGCVVVTVPSPMKPSCASLSKVLYTCGDAWDVSTLGTCVDVGVGDMGEQYHCCNKPGFP